MSQPTYEQASNIPVAIAAAIYDRLDKKANWDVLVTHCEDTTDLHWDFIGPVIDDIQADFEYQYPESTGKVQKGEKCSSS